MTRTTLAVLEAFVDAGPDGRLYGLEIMKAAGIQSGTLYPILDRLEDAEWLEGEWEHLDADAAGRPRRRYYHLTSLGRSEARGRIASRKTRLRPRLA